MTDAFFTSKTDNWATPQNFFDKLNQKFHFTLDPCADDKNHKVDKYYTKEQDGLKQSWSNEIVFCNPPYGKEISKWVEKADHEVQYNNATVVLLIPARTDTIYFHEFIYNRYEIEFLKGRLRFGDNSDKAPFPSMLVYMKKGEQHEIR